MPTYYLDQENGNDAADGLTFANRWKTITGGATAARIAPGDIIRIMKSPDPTSLGINATWTDKSRTVTLASALNALVHDCNSIWTASANVTATLNTSAFIQPGPRTGSGCAQLAIAAGFTTGKAAYVALGGAQDFSAYEGLTLWVYVSAALAASTLSLRLCSDAIGDVTVDTLPLPAITASGQWVGLHLDAGAALGASIQSIALYADLDPGVLTVYLDNISTTRAAGADCLTLRTLIGKNTAGETWWGLREINGTALTLDTNPQMLSGGFTTSRGYSGTTESVTTYIRTPIATTMVAATTTAVSSVQDSGSAGSPIIFSGGWDRTAMTTQDGETWWDGRSGFGYGFYFNAKNFVRVDQLHLVRYNQAFRNDGSYNEYGTVTGNNSVIGCYLQNGLGSSSNPELPGVLVDGTMFCCSNGGAGLSGGNLTRVRATGTITANSNGFSGSTSGFDASINGDCEFSTITAKNNVWSGFLPSAAAFAHLRITALTTDDNGQSGFAFQAGVRGVWIGTLTSRRNGGNGWLIGANNLDGVRIDTAVLTDNAVGGITGATISPGTRIVVGSITTSGNTSYGLGFGTWGGEITFLASSLAEGTPLTLTGAAYAGGWLRFQNYNGVAGDHRHYYNGGTGGRIFSDQGADRHTASGLAWKLSPQTTTYINDVHPMKMPIGKIAVNAGTLVTVRLWAKRDDTGLTLKLVLPGAQYGGPAADTVDTITAAAGIWEELEITWTPTAAGVVELEAWAYGGSALNAWIDDMTLMQA